MDEDDLMNVMEVSKQIENEVESDGDGIGDVPEVTDASVVMEDVTGKITCDSALESFESHEIQTEGCETVIIRDKKPNDNRGLNAKKGKNKRRKLELWQKQRETIRNTRDVIGGIFSISKPNQVDVKNPTKAVNKGEHLKKGERLKSEREKALKVRAKPMKVCGYCKEKTTEHTKKTCPKNPKARKKMKATPVIDVY
ncbi:hypothetical protein Tco_0788909 [Tanacetum coccineum]